MDYPSLYEKMIDSFRAYRTLTEAEVHAIVESMDVREFPKGDYIIREGDQNVNSFFVLKGLIREYKLAKAQDISTNFYREGQWIILPDESLPGDGLSINLQCLENTMLVVGNEQKARVLFETFPSLERIARQLMENHFSEQQKWLRILQTQSPEERFTALLDERPELFQRVSQAQLASYIGVRPESLSRIRRRIYDRTTH